MEASTISINGAAGSICVGFCTLDHQVNDDESRIEQDAGDDTVRNRAGGGGGDIVDAQRLEEGAVATVKLPFRLRGGTHTNWFSAEELPPIIV